MTAESHPSSVARIAVIGGGLTGLAAAHRLGELGRERYQPIDVTLYEAGPQLGGLVGTVERDGYLIDVGADSFITNKPGAIGLCRRLGLEERLQATDPRYRGALVLRNGRPLPVPEGFQLLSPARLGPVLASPILSPLGKLRLAREYFVPPRRDQQDETLASFVRRRFGSEVLDRLVQPLVGGIYTSDPEKLSLAATLPRFLEMERQHGSLLRAAFAPPAKGGLGGVENEELPAHEKGSRETDDHTSGGARYGLFAGLRGGMRDLVDALVAVVKASCTVETGVEIIAIEPASSASSPGAYRLRRRDSRESIVDAMIVTLPAYRAADSLMGFDAALASSLRGIEYASSAIVVSGHALKDIANPLHSFGLVVPHIERRRILAVSFSSRKFPNRAPDGRVLLRTFVGGAMQPDFCDLDDASLRQLVREELRDTLGVTGDADFMEIYRYPRSMPQYHLGHLDRVAEIERLAQQHRGLALAGNAYRGVGIPDAITSGERAAEAVLANSFSASYRASD